MIKLSEARNVEKLKSDGLVSYPEALALMDERVQSLILGQKPELCWFLEHPPLYTAGTSSQLPELLDSQRFPVFEAGRGGHYTYHGPGQRVVYVMHDLRQRGQDLHAHVTRLEEWIIQTLALLGVKGERRTGRVGVWVVSGGQEAKIAAIGVRVRRWVTSHGLALNVAPDLTHFNGIIPCGISGYGVTSLKALGCSVPMADVDAAFLETEAKVFG